MADHERYPLAQVNRTFRDAIHTSPLLQHKIDLCATGFEHNTAAGVSLVESRNAFVQYRSNLDSLRPVEKRKVKTLKPSPTIDFAKAAGGVYATPAESSVRLFTPGSASRRIPQKEWEVPLPVDQLGGYDFCTSADVIAFVGTKTQDLPRQTRGFDFWIEIQLRTLSDGGHHPAALWPMIQYAREETQVASSRFLSTAITNSRLAMLADVKRMSSLVVWDWRSAQILFVCQFFDHDLSNNTQEPCRSSKPIIILLWSSSTIAGYWAALDRRRRHHHLLC